MNGNIRYKWRGALGVLVNDAQRRKHMAWLTRQFQLLKRDLLSFRNAATTPDAASASQSGLRADLPLDVSPDAQAADQVHAQAAPAAPTHHNLWRSLMSLVRSFSAATWAVFVVSWLLAALFISFIVVRVGQPTDNTRLAPGLARAWQPNGVYISPLYEHPDDANSIQNDDLLIAVDGIPLANITEGLMGGPRFVPSLQLDEQRIYSVVRDGRQLDLIVRPTPYPFSAILRNGWGLLLCAFLSTVMATAITLAKPNANLSRAMVLWAMAVWGVATYSIGAQVSDLFDAVRFWHWNILAYFGWLLFMVAIVRFALVFAPPSTRLFQTLNRPFAVFLTYFLPFGLTSALMLAGWLTTPNKLIWLGRVTPLGSIIGLIYFSLFVVLMVQSYLFAEDENSRRKIRLVVAGSVIGAIPNILFTVLPILLVGESLLDTNVAALFGLPTLLAITIAVLRYRLLDIDWFINRTLVYTTVTGTLALLYGAVLAAMLLMLSLMGPTFERFFGPVNSSLTNSAVVTATVVVFVAIFNPLRERVQNVVDRRFYPSKYAAQQTITEFGDAMRNEVNLDRLKERLGSVLEHTLQPTSLTLWECWNTADCDDIRDDPFTQQLVRDNTAVDLDDVLIDSPLVQRLRKLHVQVVVPLISQSEFFGLLELGPRKDRQDYARDELNLLSVLAIQAAPILHIAQLAQIQQAEALERQKLEQEMNVARRIQQALLPKETPQVPEMTFDAHYQPARAVGGDFYDYIPLADGRVVVVIGDVSGKGVPAAMIMSSTRTVIRGAVRRLGSPSDTLTRANEILQPEMPSGMFVTVFCAVYDPATHTLRYSNAGHNLPYRILNHTATPLLARGMPLGMLPNMTYEERETTLAEGEQVLLYSDGLVEAHNPLGDMFGNERLSAVLAASAKWTTRMKDILGNLRQFVGADWSPEDDITMVTLHRASGNPSDEHMIEDFTFPGEPGQDKDVALRVGAALAKFGMVPDAASNATTVVAEAAINAIEYGARNEPSLRIRVQIFTADQTLRIRVTDPGLSNVIPEIKTPDIQAKLAGQQSPRGWGLFLIRSLTDEMRFERNPETGELSLEVAWKLTDENWRRP